jgi:hypothetical protein
VTCGVAGPVPCCMINCWGAGDRGSHSRLGGVLEAVVTIVLIAVLLLVAGVGGFAVHRLFRHTAGPRRDG